MASVSLERVRKTYPGGQQAVRDVNLEVSDGALVALVGPSGSGKSTVLRLIAGLDTPTAGRIRLDGQDVTHVPPQKRDLAMVFQSYALYPHKTVRDNLTFGLQVRRVDPSTITARVQSVAVSLGIDALLDRVPAQLSGGERQRVALGRAIVREPRGFLLDEPLSNLDPRLRAATRAELALLHRRLGATMIYVTHDQEEAMTLGERVAVMRDGALEQIGTPMDVFDRPVNTFVAEFIGSPALNLLPAGIPGIDGGGHATTVGIRPHDLELTSVGEGDLIGRVEVAEPLGSTAVLHVRADAVPGQLIRIVVPSDAALAVDAPIGLRLRRDRLHRFDASGRRIA